MEGRYLYCVVKGHTLESFGKVGIEDEEVYTVPYRDIAAVVHRCAAEPYDTRDEEKAKEWLLTHNYVIDSGTKRYGTVLPAGFDTIIRGDEEQVLGWLSQDYTKLKEMLEDVTDKAEYGIQIFWDPAETARQIRDATREVEVRRYKMEGKPVGLAYLFERKLDKIVNGELKSRADAYAQEFYEQVKEMVHEVRPVEARQMPSDQEDKEMILALSCLVPHGLVEGLGRLLEGINDQDGFSVRFTGPWAPFSFVD